jgi:signal transduction histidine kinase
MVRRQFELDNIRFELALADGLAPVRAHSNRLQQVIFNLVTNARDAINDVSNADTGGDRRIVIRTGDHDGGVFLEVEDTGGGIDEKDRQKIFEPFFTTKEAGQGMGLGLAITYGIIKDYGGEIRIDSTKGRGTVFRMEFPAAARGETKA